MRDRPLWYFGDQDVLAALLSSADFADVDVHLLRQGRDIVQLLGPEGWSVRDRLAQCFRPGPPLVHAQGRKPWVEPDPQRAAWARWFERLQAELSVYTLAANRYRDEVGVDMPWLRRRSVIGTVLRASDGGQLALRGMPLVLAKSIAYHAPHRWLRGSGTP